MSAFKARVKVSDDHTISGLVSADVPAGEHEMTIFVENQGPRFFSVEDLPLHDLPWEADVSLRRKDFYGDDGR